MSHRTRLVLVGSAISVIILVIGLAVLATPTTASLETQVASSLPLCGSGALERSAFQTPVPVAAGPTATSAASAPSTPIPPTPTPRPAPATDRVGYPDNYQNTFRLLYIIDRGPAGQVRVICGNDIAASRAKGDPFPYGSVIAMENWRAKRDASGKLVLLSFQ